MPTTTFYPVLMSQDVATASTFYRELLDFETTFESDWYVSMRTGAFELAILAHDHPTIPEGYRSLPSGVLVNLEVDNIGALHDRLITNPAVEVVQALRDEDFGQRHFILAAPDGVLLDVIQLIAPSAEYAGAYAETGT